MPMPQTGGKSNLHLAFVRALDFMRLRNVKASNQIGKKLSVSETGKFKFSCWILRKMKYVSDCDAIDENRLSLTSDAQATTRSRQVKSSETLKNLQRIKETIDLDFDPQGTCHAM